MEVFIPYENRKINVETYLLDVLQFHLESTPYWQRNLTKRKIDELVSSDFKETVYNLSRLEVDQDLLRTRWQEFRPRNLKNTRLSFSSGTTGPQKYCLWSEDYIEKQANYLAYYLSKRGIKLKNAIIQGPTSIYKEVNEKLVNKLGGDPYFVGLRVEGLKPIIEDAAKKGEKELIKVLKEYFAIEIQKTKRLLEYDQDINFMRSAWMMLAFFEEFYGDKQNIKIVMTSGLGYSPQNHETLKQKFERVIASYGYFAFGDALGKYVNGNLDYYPAFPYAIFTVIKEDGEIAKYGEEGHPLFIIARKDLLLILKENNETAKRVGPTEEFPWDGIRNPKRKIEVS